MKFLYFLFAGIITVFSGCKKQTDTKIPDGTYYGTFQRSLISGDEQIANVLISFNEGKWSGQSDIPNYPALCRGTYRIENNKLIFENECAWTADFDWSLILSGMYEYNLSGDSLFISKKYGNAAIETYSDIYSVSLRKTGIKQSPLTGTWVENLQKTDTLVFSPEYDGQYPIVTLNRNKRESGEYSVPGYSTGPYWYILGKNSISLNWFLSSNSIFNRYFFTLMPSGNQLKIGRFFTDTPPLLENDTLTFTKIN